MKRKCIDVEAKEHVYPAAEYSPDIKNLLSAVEVGLRKKKWTEEEVREFFSSIGYGVSRATLYRWELSSNTTGIAVQVHPNGGRERLLDCWQMGVWVGFDAEQKYVGCW
jgi:hypothetical protein